MSFIGSFSRRNASVPDVVKPFAGQARIASPSLRIAQIGAFSALIALGTVLSNMLLGFSLPPPLFEITVAPAFYLAIAVLYPRRVSFWSTAIGSGVGEAVNIFAFGVPPAFALTFVPGIILARAPETAIVHRFRLKSTAWMVIVMGIATVYETLAFFLIDWPVYSFTVFYGCPSSPCAPPGLVGGFALAAFDFGTMVDVLWIPIALLLITAVRRAFNVRFFE